MSAIGLILVARANEKIKKEQEKWEIKKVGNESWTAVSPSGEKLSIIAETRGVVEALIRNKIRREKGYGTIPECGQSNMGTH